MYSARDDSSRNAAPTLEAEDALREHDDALSGSAKTMEDTKKLLEETAAGASRLLEMNRRLREELDAMRAERDAARAEAQETRARADAPVVGPGAPEPDKKEEVAALRAALAEAERNLRTVSAGFSMLRREREEALNVLKGSEATRAALDAERAAVARVREALTLPTSSKTSNPQSDDGKTAGKNVFLAALAARSERAATATETATDSRFPSPLFFVGEEAIDRQLPFREPTGAGLSAAAGARASDDASDSVGGGFSFAAPKHVSRRVVFSGARRPGTARGGRVGSIGGDPPFPRAATARRDRDVVASDESDLETEGDLFATEDASVLTDASDSDGFDLNAGLVATTDARAASRDARTGRQLARPSDTRRRTRDRRLDLARRRAGGRASEGSGARDARADREGALPLTAQARARRSTGGSRVSSRAGTPAASPAKRSASLHARRDRERLRGKGVGEERKPAFRPAGVATRAIPAELLTGATLGAAARRLVEGTTTRRALRAR